MLKYSVKIAVLSLSAFFCFAGQSPRKEVEEVPSTQFVENEIKLEKQESSQNQKKELKSAAKRSMEAQKPIVRKSAAKRSMERVD